MLGVSAAAQFMSGPGQSYSVAAFKEPMRDTLAVTETSYSLTYGIATLVSGVTLPWTGRLLDHVGARRMLPVIAGLLALACAVISRVESLMGLCIGFTLIRCLGQGALTLVAAWIVGEWFLRKRGLATALSGLGSSTSVMALPLFNGWLIDHFGWRNAWLVLGAVVATTLVLPAWLLLRDHPEEMGLCPDGDPTTTPTKTRAVSRDVSTESWSLSQALRDATFWKLLSVPACTGMVGTGMIFHQVSILGQRGVSSQAALGLISLQATVATVAALGAGWLTDRLPTEKLLAAAMGLLCAGILVILGMRNAWMSVVYACLFGLHGSILRSAGTVVWVNYYGRANQGAIRGVSMSVMILAAAVGPLPLAVAHDRLGTYQPAMYFFVAIAAMAGGLVLTASRPDLSTSSQDRHER